MSIASWAIPSTMLPTADRNDYSAPAIGDRDASMSLPTPDAAPNVLIDTGSRKKEKYSNEIWNLPNALTLFRIFLVPFLVVVLLTKFSGREFVGLAIFLVAAITDFFDGWVARRRHQTPRRGARLDPLAATFVMSAAVI